MTQIRILRDQIIPDGMTIAEAVRGILDAGTYEYLDIQAVRPGTIVAADAIYPTHASYIHPQTGDEWHSMTGDFEVVDE